MKREIYHRGVPGKKWGIWNTMKKTWQFGICEDTPMLAEARLYQRIGDDARKYRFEPRILPGNMGGGEKIEALNLSDRARNALRRRGIETVEQLRAIPIDELLKMRGIGDVTALEIRQRVQLVDITG